MLRRSWRRSSGSCPADDPTLRATVLAVADELSEQGFVLRYRTDETDDGLSGKEGSFVICSFWLVSAAGDRGRDAAGARSDGAPREVRRSGCQELERGDRQHLGNFPQAFSHLAWSPPLIPHLIMAAPTQVGCDLWRRPFWAAPRCVAVASATELPTVEGASATVSAGRTLVRARFRGPPTHRGPRADHQDWVTTAHPVIPQARINDTATHNESRRGKWPSRTT